MIYCLVIYLVSNVFIKFCLMNSNFMRDKLISSVVLFLAISALMRPTDKSILQIGILKLLLLLMSSNMIIKVCTRCEGYPTFLASKWPISIMNTLMNYHIAFSSEIFRTYTTSKVLFVLMFVRIMLPHVLKSSK